MAKIIFESNFNVCLEFDTHTHTHNNLATIRSHVEIFECINAFQIKKKKNNNNKSSIRDLLSDVVQSRMES